MRETETSHFWVGHFPEALAYDYFAEHYDEDDDDEPDRTTPLSAFARDQGEMWYDHDFLEYGFSNTAKSVAELVAGASYSDQWGTELARRAAAASLTGVNWLAFISKSEIDRPRSVQGDGYWLHYLGTIQYRI